MKLNVRKVVGEQMSSVDDNISHTHTQRHFNKFMEQVGCH